jgi:hypothetical protein
MELKDRCLHKVNTWICPKVSGSASGNRHYE